MMLGVFALLELFLPDAAWKKSERALMTSEFEILQLVTATIRSFKLEILVSLLLFLTCPLLMPYPLPPPSTVMCIANRSESVAAQSVALCHSERPCH